MIICFYAILLGLFLNFEFTIFIVDVMVKIFGFLNGMGLNLKIMYLDYKKSIRLRIHYRET